MDKRRLTPKRQKIVQAVHAANPDINVDRLAKIVQLTLLLDRQLRGR